MAFYSLTQFNRDAGTRFTRWSQVVKAIIDSRPVLTPGEDQRDNGPPKTLIDCDTECVGDAPCPSSDCGRKYLQEKKHA